MQTLNQNLRKKYENAQIVENVVENISGVQVATSKCFKETVKHLSKRSLVNIEL